MTLNLEFENLNLFPCESRGYKRITRLQTNHAATNECSNQCATVFSVYERWIKHICGKVSASVIKPLGTGERQPLLDVSQVIPPSAQSYDSVLIIKKPAHINCCYRHLSPKQAGRCLRTPGTIPSPTRACVVNNN